MVLPSVSRLEGNVGVEVRHRFSSLLSRLSEEKSCSVGKGVGTCLRRSVEYRILLMCCAGKDLVSNRFPYPNDSDQISTRSLFGSKTS